jgi:hypothetical protein
MKRLGLMIAALAAMAAASVPASALAQAKAAAKPAAKLDAKQLEAQRAAGKKEAPAVIQTAGLPCTMTDARYIGTTKQKGEDGKEVQAKAYEVACQQGLGYTLIAGAGRPTVYDCLTLLGNAGLECQLPGNANPKQGFSQFVAAAPRACTVSDVRAIGSSKSGEAYYEVACREGPGFVVDRKPDMHAELVDCMQAGGALECKLTTQEQINGWIGQFATKAKKQCQISETRIVGQEPKTGNVYYELGCGAKPGFMVLADKSGNVVRTIECASAVNLAGGCKFTNAVQAQTQAAGLYSQLAQKAGFPCQVNKYNPIGVDNKKREVVELACANRPDGAIALFSDNPADTEILDCVRAAAIDQTCRLSSANVVFAKYTAALSARGKGSCKVSNARWIGHYEKSNTDLIETACADGLPGWVVEVDQKSNAKTLLSCGQAAHDGIQCVLPTNTKKG